MNWMQKLGLDKARQEGWLDPDEDVPFEWTDQGQRAVAQFYLETADMYQRGQIGHWTVEDVMSVFNRAYAKYQEAKRRYDQRN